MYFLDEPLPNLARELGMATDRESESWCEIVADCLRLLAVWVRNSDVDGKIQVYMKLRSDDGW